MKYKTLINLLLIILILSSFSMAEVSKPGDINLSKIDEQTNTSIQLNNFINCQNLQYLNKLGSTRNAIRLFEGIKELTYQYKNFAYSNCDYPAIETIKINNTAYSKGSDTFSGYSSGISSFANATAKVFLDSLFSTDQEPEIGDIEILPNGQYMKYTPNEQWVRCIKTASMSQNKLQNSSATTDKCFS